MDLSGQWRQQQQPQIDAEVCLARHEAVATAGAIGGGFLGGGPASLVVLRSAGAEQVPQPTGRTGGASPPRTGGIKWRCLGGGISASRLSGNHQARKYLCLDPHRVAGVQESSVAIARSRAFFVTRRGASKDHRRSPYLPPSTRSNCSRQPWHQSLAVPDMADRLSSRTGQGRASCLSPVPS